MTVVRELVTESGGAACWVSAQSRRSVRPGGPRLAGYWPSRSDIRCGPLGGRHRGEGKPRDGRACVSPPFLRRLRNVSPVLRTRRGVQSVWRRATWCGTVVGVERIVVIGCAAGSPPWLGIWLPEPVGRWSSGTSLASWARMCTCPPAIAGIVASSRWVLDAASYYASELVYAAADTVIFLDYAKHVVMWRVLRRTLGIDLLDRAGFLMQRRTTPASSSTRRPIRSSFSTTRSMW